MARLWCPVAISGPHCSTWPWRMDRPIVVLYWSPSRRSQMTRSSGAITHLTTSGARGCGFCDTTWYTTCSMNWFHSWSWTWRFSTKLLTPRLNITWFLKFWVRSVLEQARIGSGLGMICRFMISGSKPGYKWNVPWMFGNFFFVYKNAK